MDQAPNHQADPAEPPAAPGTVSRELAQLCLGRECDRTVLAGLVYQDLRAAAAQLMARERSAHTLQPTALVHEAWIRLVDEPVLRDVPVAEARRNFLGFAVQAMRRILVEHARARLREKRGGAQRPGQLPDALAAAIDDAPEMLDLDAALESLAIERPRLAQLAELRIYGGLSIAEASEHLGVALSTAKADWALASALLAQRVRGAPRRT